MALPIALALTACFAVCGTYAATRLVGAGASDRPRYQAHVAMAVAMLAMAWLEPPALLAALGAAGFGAVSVGFARAAFRAGSLPPLHHAGMAAVMAAMWLSMALTHHEHDMAHDHEDTVGGHMAYEHAAAALLPPVLLVSAVALVVLGVAWWGKAHRSHWFEGLASLGMALGAAAMAVAH